MAQIEKGAKRYPSDLTNEEWERTAPFDAAAARGPNAAFERQTIVHEATHTLIDAP
jgi:hypothetical protein